MMGVGGRVGMDLVKAPVVSISVVVDAATKPHGTRMRLMAVTRF